MGKLIIKRDYNINDFVFLLSVYSLTPSAVGDMVDTGFATQLSPCHDGSVKSRHIIDVIDGSSWWSSCFSLSFYFSHKDS